MRLLFLCLLLLFCAACQRSTRLLQPPPAVTADDLSPDEIAQAQEQHKLIVGFTDQILSALATKQYSQLSDMLPRDSDVSPRDVAEILLGSDFDRVTLNRWNAQQIKVTFDRTFCRATARVQLTYRSSRNRKPSTVPFTLHFRRASNLHRWSLHFD